MVCVFVVLVCILHASVAQRFGFGFCPKTSPVDNFDVVRYLGKWYEIAKYPNIFQNGHCTEANYGPIDNEGRVKVVNKEIQDGQVSAIDGFAQQPHAHRGDLEVFLNVPIVGLQKSNYDVLATDYENFALVHACRQILGVFKFDFVWILSRRRTLSDESAAIVNLAMEQNTLDKGPLKITSQANCQD